MGAEVPYEGLEPGFHTSPQHHGHRLSRKLFSLCNNSQRNFAEALWLPQAQRSRNPGDFKAAPEKESIQQHFLLLGGDTSVETTILE